MLVLSRKLNESIVIDGDIRITIVGIRGNHVRVGIEAPGSVPIMREELQDRIGGPTPQQRPQGDAIARPRVAGNPA